VVDPEPNNILRPVEALATVTRGAFVVLVDDKGVQYHVSTSEFLAFVPTARDMHGVAAETLDLDARTAEMQKCRDEGMTLRQIASRFNLSENRVRHYTR